jgi:hypothetical protein
MAQCVHVRANLREVQNGLKYTQKLPNKRFDICIIGQIRLCRALAQGHCVAFRGREGGRLSHRRELSHPPVT